MRTAIMAIMASLLAIMPAPWRDANAMGERAYPCYPFLDLTDPSAQWSRPLGRVAIPDVDGVAVDLPEDLSDDPSDDGIRMTGAAGIAEVMAANLVEHPENSVALFHDQRTGDFLIVAFVRSGFIDQVDWSDVSQDRLFASIRHDTLYGQLVIVDNATRIRPNRVDLDGWVTAPTYAPEARRIHWSVQCSDREAPVYTAVDLRFGRNGFLALTRVSLSRERLTTGRMAQVAQKGIAFEPGHRPGDALPTDDRTANPVAALGLEFGSGSALDPAREKGLAEWLIELGMGLLVMLFKGGFKFLVMLPLLLIKALVRSPRSNR